MKYWVRLGGRPCQAGSILHDGACRALGRLQGIDLKSYEFGSVFVDPPRAGMDPDTCELTRRFDNILYISCNPVTLAENIAQLHDTHRIERCAVFDQFPWTHHMESGVLLVRR